MIITVNGERFHFRECDTTEQGWTPEEVQDRAEHNGEMRYEANGNAWLMIHGIGYGLRL